jgi:hypothetical protein
MDSRDAWCATKNNQSFDVGEDLMLPAVGEWVATKRIDKRVFTTEGLRFSSSGYLHKGIIRIHLPSP